MFRNDPENETDFIFIYHGWIFYGFSSQIICNERTCNEKLQCSRVLQGRKIIAVCASYT